MDKKFFVPYQTARQLKEKGYPQELATMYYDTFSGGEINLITDRECVDCVVEGNDRHPLFKRLSELYIAAPTHHEVVDWLEGKDIIIESAKRWTENYCYVWSSDIIRRDNLIKTCIGETREEAFDEAIIYALTII